MPASILTFDITCSLVAGHALVTFFAAGKWRYELHHDAALRLGRKIMRAGHAQWIDVELPAGWRVEPGTTALTHKPQVVIHAPNGRHVSIDRAPARSLGEALMHRAKAADEHEHAQQIAMDQALILRSGALPFGLTAHPKILDLAANLAVNDDDLRRYLPGGVRAGHHVPMPGVFHTTMPGGSGPLDPAAIVRPEEPRHE